jgi:CBS domain-containing protein
MTAEPRPIQKWHAAMQCGGEDMKVRALLESKGNKVVSIDAGSSVEDAIRSMHSRKISALMATEQGKTVGIFTERDVVRCYLSSGGKSFKDVKVRDAMVTDLVVAVPDDDLDYISVVMVEKNIRHLPVFENSQIVGMLSIRDIIQTQVKKLASEVHYLKDYITGY